MSGHSERPVMDVLQDIVGNVQDILHSELQLARTQIKDAASDAARPAATLGVGVVLAIHAVGLLLLAAVVALAQVVAVWAAALIVGGTVGVVAIALIAIGQRGLSRVARHSASTIASFKESTPWATKPGR